MKRLERAHRFLFEPARFKNDPAVQKMVPAALGGYAILWCEGWDQVEPGVFLDDDRILARLARLSPEEWVLYRPQIVEAFDTTSRPGFWIQKGTVATHEAQRERFRAKSASGKAGANARWRNEKDAGAIPDAIAPASECHSRPNATAMARARAGSGSGVGSENLSPAASAAPPSAPPAGDKRPPRAKARATLETTPEQRAACAVRFKLPRSTVDLLADRIALEGPSRGYSSGYSALLNWCKREADKAAAEAPATAPRPPGFWSHLDAAINDHLSDPRRMLDAQRRARALAQERPAATAGELLAMLELPPRNGECVAPGEVEALVQGVLEHWQMPAAALEELREPEG
jgi:hypothetical protein